MLKNSAEFKSGIIVCNDAVQNPEMQIRNKYSRDESKLPDGSKILMRVEEALRQVEGSRLNSIGWVDGDAWFRSVGSFIESLFV